MGIKSMRDLTEKFNRAECIENIKKLIGDYTLEELPHYDTINDCLEELPPEELKIIRHKMIERLIKMKCFEPNKFNKRWLVSIDGTGLYVFKERHCDHCLTKTYRKGKPDEYTLYFHYVLEAKLTIGSMELSLCSEFIENPEKLKEKEEYKQDFDDKKKQDCERKAFYRMAEKLKKEYPRLPICLLLDSLYANQNVFQICQENGWEYIIRFKEGSIPSVAKEFDTLSRYDKSITIKEIEDQTHTYRYVNDIEYGEHKINVVEYTETQQLPVTGAEETKKTFTFITSPKLRISKKSQEEVVLIGRKRWGIENHGFNEQKNHGYELTHPFSHNYVAMKNHYILIQISHIIRQLFEEGVKILKEHKKSLADIFYVLLESFRNERLLSSDLEDINRKRQIRINAALQ